jgi:F0F1-type ATP synthase assembly protein I
MNETENKNETEKDNLSPKDNDSISETYVIAAKISGIGVEMVVPMLLGVGLDYLFGTVAVFVIIGAISGTVLAFRQLITISDKY